MGAETVNSHKREPIDPVRLDIYREVDELEGKYDELLQFQREQASFTNRIIKHIERLQEEIDRLRGS